MLHHVALVVLVGVFVDSLGDAMCGGAVVAFLIDDIGGGALAYGILTMCRRLSTVVGMWLTGAMVDHRYIKTAIVLHAFGALFGSVTMGLATTVPMFVITSSVSMIMGQSEPLVSRIVFDIVPEAKRASVMSLVESISALSYVIVPSLAGMLAQYVNLRAPVYVTMAVDAALLVVAFGTHRCNVALADDTVTEHVSYRMLTNILWNMRSHVVQKMLFDVAAILNNFTLNFLLKDVYKLNVTQVAVVLTISGCVALAFNLIGAVILSRVEARRVVIVMPCIMLVGCVLRATLSMRADSFWKFPNMVLYFTSVLFDHFAGCLFYPAFYAIVLEYSPSQAVGRVRAGLGLFDTAVGMISPPLAASLFSSWHHRAPYVVAASFAMLCVLYSRVLTPRGVVRFNSREIQPSSPET